MKILYFNRVKISLPIFSPICRFFRIFPDFLPIFRDVQFFEKIVIFRDIAEKSAIFSTRIIIIIVTMILNEMI